MRECCANFKAPGFFSTFADTAFSLLKPARESQQQPTPTCAMFKPKYGGGERA
jgi:hypothetical protein